MNSRAGFSRWALILISGMEIINYIGPLGLVLGHCRYYTLSEHADRPAAPDLIIYKLSEICGIGH